MADYSFRFRIKRASSKTIAVDTPELELLQTDSQQIVLLKSGVRDKSIQDSENWIVQSSGWPSEEEAFSAGVRIQNALQLVLARLRIGADFGTRGPKSHIFDAGLEMLRRVFGVERLLRDKQEVMAYETYPEPRFASASIGGVSVHTPADKFNTELHRVLKKERELRDQEQLALELYNASFFQVAAEARFLLLMMAIEAMLDPQPRPEESLEHVERLISLTKESDTLTSTERDSMLGSLRWLRQQSITQAGKALASERLGNKCYKDMDPGTFFSKCYGVRSDLVHGRLPLSEWDRVNSLCATLEGFVADLIRGVDSSI